MKENQKEQKSNYLGGRNNKAQKIARMLVLLYQFLIKWALVCVCVSVSFVRLTFTAA